MDSVFYALLEIFFICANEEKLCGLVQHLILHMPRDVILELSDSISLNGDMPLALIKEST